MIRFQVQLTDRQAASIKEIAYERGTSVAAVVRDAVDRLIEEPASREAIWEVALSVVGKYRGDGENVAVEHDRYLEESYGDWEGGNGGRA
jgi:hypothetical protein